MHISNSLLIIITTALVTIASVQSARKCSGRWAIHACYGGNGKRSNPPLSTDSQQQQQQQNDRQYLLRQLLFGAIQPQLDTIDMSDSTGYSDADDLYPTSEEYANQSDLKREKSLLRFLTRQSHYSKRDDAIFVCVVRLNPKPTAVVFYKAGFQFSRSITRSIKSMLSQQRLLLDRKLQTPSDDNLPFIRK